MESQKTIDVLKSWGSDNTHQLAVFMNHNHIISDEDDLGLSSMMIENWTEECDQYLKKYGYNGGKIKKTGKFFPNIGAVYVLFDENKITYEAAIVYLKTVSEKT